MAKRKTRAVEALLPAFIQGGTGNWFDEILRAGGADDAADYLTQLERDNPVAFGAANLAGNVVPSLGLTGLAIKGAKGLDLLRRAAAIDASVGAATGAGGYDPGARETLEERAGMAALGGAAGAVTAGLVPAAFSGANQARLNLPTLSGKPPLHADQYLVAADAMPPFRLVDEALARDEALRRAGKGWAPDAGPGIFGAWGKEQLRPVDTLGPNVRSLMGVAMREKNAASVFSSTADADFRTGIMEQIKGYRTWEDKVVPRSPPSQAKKKQPLNDLRQDLMAALDDEGAHGEWVTLAREMWGEDPAGSYKFAGALLQRIEKRAQAATGDELVTLAQRLDQGGDLQKKLQALGVEQAGATKAVRRARRLRDEGQKVEKEQTRPRSEQSMRFTSADDRLNTLQGRQREGKGAPELPDDSPPIAMQDWEASAVMNELLKPRRMNYVPPSQANAPMFDVRMSSRAKWENPFVAADPGVAKGGAYAGKFVPPIMDQVVSGQGLSYLPEVVRDMLEQRRARSEERPKSRWVPG